MASGNLAGCFWPTYENVAGERPSPFSASENNESQGVVPDVPSTGDERDLPALGSAARAVPGAGCKSGELPPSRVARAGDVWETSVTTPYKIEMQNDQSRHDKLSYDFCPRGRGGMVALFFLVQPTTRCPGIWSGRPGPVGTGVTVQRYRSRRPAAYGVYIACRRKKTLVLFVFLGLLSGSEVTYGTGKHAYHIAQ
jgi:hypothetical protein